MEKILVYGKAQNRTALGIVNAYLVMYPHATLVDLDRAFPIKLNSSNRHTSLFADVVKDRDKFKTQKEGNDVFEMFFFEKDDEGNPTKGIGKCVAKTVRDTRYSLKRYQILRICYCDAYSFLLKSY